jgi:lipoprotein-releasing system permease protein
MLVIQKERNTFDVNNYMNLELFIAKRLALGDNKSFSRFIIRIAVVAIALSVAVMIVSTCMVSGFSKEIKERIFGFWGEDPYHFNFDNNESFESTSPIKKGAGFTRINYAKQKR